MNFEFQTDSEHNSKGKIPRETTTVVSKAWIEYQKSINSENPCFDSARRGDVEALKARIGTLRHVDEKNRKGYTLLMLAAYNGQEEASLFLISQGANPNSTDLEGNSILMGAAFKGHTKIVEILLSAGADKNYRNSKGQNAFQFSNMFGRTEVSKLLSESESTRFQRLLTFFKSWILYIIQIKKGEQ
ncbi:MULTISPECIES: ankyrin repeat domain-containing protein [Leptospira]|uniref:Ankyrin repeat protein n=3 Tax=Leptospira weilii TaxID=28184 RepID=N1UGV6_9LEPT|nr:MULTISPECIES: ankyrin repeat domain-containing protein [Leptospira]EMM70378.1 ankyrin repeat protein [Leptospira weilii str. 2006001855]EMY15255.1 ankyrin repeat protein [Leptospira weilii str. Ecochallenge]EMJ60828.1 ankyrin repeat protein [Leptospira sp. P2653]EMN91256.1 ankyrin repeat protein [Leptospira weilii str. UI 13098]MCL8267421.1 ankyrin repeat domain-containing protein [Leptospira weilii]